MNQDNQHKRPKKGDSAAENLEKQFRALGDNEKSPDNLKKEVFNTLDTLALVGDFMDLFTAKFTESEAQMMETIGGKKEDGIGDENDAPAGEKDGKNETKEDKTPE